MTELARITENGRLVAEADWKAHIMNLQAQVQHVPSLAHEGEQLAEIESTLCSAVKQRTAGQTFGLLLSGGVDSTLLAVLCKELQRTFRCYTVGIEESADLIAARSVAKKLDLQHTVRVYTRAELHPLFAQTARLLPTRDVLSVGVGAVVLAGIQLAQRDGVRMLMGGLGSEEIFAGYERHGSAPEVNAECWNGLFNMHGRDLVRDCALAQATHTSFLTPFLDPRVIITAMRIPGNAKVCATEKKIILRKFAAAMGVPDAIAFRKKQAAQYGSRFDHAMEKLAKQKGFPGKKEYVASLCAKT